MGKQTGGTEAAVVVCAALIVIFASIAVILRAVGQ